MIRADGVSLRYLINGALATGLHFLVLWSCLNIFDLSSTGISNFIAAVIASAGSFAGNRYFVFVQSARRAKEQAKGFVILYLAAAVFHGAFLFGWTDLLGLHYGIGFLLATAIQVVGVYAVNRRVVFA